MDSSPIEDASRSWKDRLRFVAGMCAVFTIALSALGLGFWLSEDPALQAWIGHWMKANTTASSLAAGLSLGLALKDSPWAKATQRALAAALVVMASLTLAQYLGGGSLGVDELLVRDRVGANPIHPGRMAPNSAVSFLLQGAALFSLTLPGRGWFHRHRAKLALLNLGLCVIALVGHLYGAHHLYQVSSYVSITVPTAMLAFLVSFGALCLMPEDRWVREITAQSLGASIARRLLSSTIPVSALLGWLSLEAQRRGMLGPDQGTAALVVTLVVLFTTILWQTAHRLNALDAERAEAENAWRRASEHLREVVEQAPASIALWQGPDLTFKLANPVYRSLVGGRELIGKTLGQAFPELEGHGIAEILERVYRTGVPFRDPEFRVRLKDPDGSDRELYLDITLQPMRGHKGEVEAVLGFAVDVTEQGKARRQIEAARAETERVARQLRLITNAIPAFISYIDRDRRYQFVNQAYVDWLEKPAAEIVGRPIAEVLPSRFHEAVEPLIRRALGGEKIAHESLVPMRDGAIKALQIHYIPDFGSDGKIRGFFVLGMDVTALRTAIRTRDEFLSIASHELKTPLTSLKLQTQSLLRRLERGDESVLSVERVLRLLSSTDRQLRQLNRLIDDMLDISRLSTGRLTLHKERCELSEIVRDVAARLIHQFEDAGCELELDLPCRVEGEWDRTRVEQVIINVMTNALKYGEGKPVRVTLTCQGGRASLSVRDQGMGIAQENHERVFQRFERAVSERAVGGLGLGLYIARQIIELHGGAIRLQSGLGQGSVFTIELPSAQVAVAS